MFSSFHLAHGNGHVPIRRGKGASVVDFTAHCILHRRSGQFDAVRRESCHRARVLLRVDRVRYQPPGSSGQPCAYPGATPLLLAMVERCVNLCSDCCECRHCSAEDEASWPDPVSFIIRHSDQADDTTGGVRKVGYGEDDSRLGGPFEEDNTIVFRSLVDEPYYWRGEAKDVYDGQGGTGEKLGSRS